MRTTACSMAWRASITNAKWAAMAKCSSDTALRDINDLMAKDVLAR